MLINFVQFLIKENNKIVNFWVPKACDPPWKTPPALLRNTFCDFNASSALSVTWAGKRAFRHPQTFDLRTSSQSFQL